MARKKSRSDQPPLDSRHGYQLGVSTMWRYITAAIDLIATAMPSPRQLVDQLAQLVRLILDGTHIPIDRIADRKPYHTGHKRRHTVDVQFPPYACGRLRWTSSALPGAIHDTAFSATHGPIRRPGRAG